MLVGEVVTAKRRGEIFDHDDVSVHEKQQQVTCISIAFVFFSHART